MYDLDEWPWALLAIAVILGTWSIWQVRASTVGRWVQRGRVVYLLSLTVLGAGSVVAAAFAARCVVPFGLAAGGLVTAMLWENPFHVWHMEPPSARQP